jgi:sulfur transfer complex TusBCD TusB component (DsrH family)
MSAASKQSISLAACLVWIAALMAACGGGAERSDSRAASPAAAQSQAQAETQADARAEEEAAAEQVHEQLHTQAAAEANAEGNAQTQAHAEAPIALAALEAQIKARGLAPSPAIRTHLLRYRDAVIPAENAAYQAIFTRLYPKRPTDGDASIREWNHWLSRWDESHAAQVRAQTDKVVAGSGHSSRNPHHRDFPR